MICCRDLDATNSNGLWGHSVGGGVEYKKNCTNIKGRVSGHEIKPQINGNLLLVLLERDSKQNKNGLPRQPLLKN
jgi:hypothetical protein